MYPRITSLTKKDSSYVITVKPRLFRREMRHIVSSYYLSHCWLVLAFTCTGSGLLLEKPKRTASS